MTNNIVLDSKQLPIQIYGIDFSGAALAGNAIWITEATADGETLTIKKCKNAAEFLDCSSKKRTCFTGALPVYRGSKKCRFGTGCCIQHSARHVSRIDMATICGQFSGEICIGGSIPEPLPRCFSRFGSETVDRSGNTNAVFAIQFADVSPNLLRYSRRAFAIGEK